MKGLFEHWANLKLEAQQAKADHDTHEEGVELLEETKGILDLVIDLDSKSLSSCLGVSSVTARGFAR
jgi:hypothetical protein